MTARPTEVRKMTEVLERDYDTAEEAARAAFEAAEQMIAERTNYVVSVMHTDGDMILFQSYGIFTTRNQAEKALSSGKIVSPGGNITSKGAIAQLTVIH